MFSYKPLLHLLLDHNMSKTEFRKRTNLSTVTLAKISKDEPISMDVLDRICDFFQCQPSDVMEHIPNSNSETGE